ncbi:hypothetical protein RFI_17499 [Reticulomyxa filosa]|uniref:PDZ domain-containing protein n=1 Tax=Reticulomyxa filosa TaxID=46433 RepID=X6N0X5_RETFI|nr:hypothetical protein RFI_17499 [Reticulomyxa filosa]|eukprot:ETO19731.1 hypothetical protein RFI_17499 [Reticulomyxa filosa]
MESYHMSYVHTKKRKHGRAGSANSILKEKKNDSDNDNDITDEKQNAETPARTKGSAKKKGRSLSAGKRESIHAFLERVMTPPVMKVLEKQQQNPDVNVGALYNEAMSLPPQMRKKEESKATKSHKKKKSKILQTKQAQTSSQTQSLSLSGSAEDEDDKDEKDDDKDDDNDDNDDNDKDESIKEMVFTKRPLGFSLHDIEGDLVVDGVKKNSPAYRKGVKQGWLVISINEETDMDTMYQILFDKSVESLTVVFDTSTVADDRDAFEQRDLTAAVAVTSTTAPTGTTTVTTQSPKRQSDSKSKSKSKSNSSSSEESAHKRSFDEELPSDFAQEFLEKRGSKTDSKPIDPIVAITKPRPISATSAQKQEESEFDPTHIRKG